MYILRFDGLFRPVSGAKRSATKAGIMCYGWLIFKNNILVARGHGAFAHANEASSNMAEYLALLEGLEALSDMGVRKQPVLVMGDAKTVIDQMTGEAAVNTSAARVLHRRAAQLARGFSNLSWRWTPRQFNREADKLTRRAMNSLRFDRAEYLAALAGCQNGDREFCRTRGMVPLVDFRVYQPAGFAL